MTGRSSFISKGKTQYHAIHFSRTSLLQKGSIPPCKDPVKLGGQYKENRIAVVLRALLNRNKKSILVLNRLLHEPLLRAGCGARPEARTEAFTAENAEHAERGGRIE
jgi:hypothetical protein